MTDSNRKSKFVYSQVQNDQARQNAPAEFKTGVNFLFQLILNLLIGLINVSSIVRCI